MNRRTALYRVRLFIKGKLAGQWYFQNPPAARKWARIQLSKTDPNEIGTEATVARVEV
jgi:hypothetical protein